MNLEGGGHEHSVRCRHRIYSGEDDAEDIQVPKAALTRPPEGLPLAQCHKHEKFCLPRSNNCAFIFTGGGLWCPLAMFQLSTNPG